MLYDGERERERAFYSTVPGLITAKLNRLSAAGEAAAEIPVAMGQLQTREQSPETRSYICPYLSPTVPHSSRLSPAAMHAPDLSEPAGITETGEA